jgi:hypothetical protein
MIKFFRKIRQNLLSKNKIGKYLLYAFGEIILVIIGILIALSLNKQNEQKQAEAKIDAIFEEIMLELENFIDKGEKEIYWYRRMDSLSSIILNTDLTHDEYIDSKNNDLWNIPLKKRGLKIDDYAYKALMLEIDAIPEKYDTVVKSLNNLYNTRYATVDEFTKKIENIVYENNEEYSKKYAWYSDPNEKNDDAINYRLTDFTFRNNVKRFRGMNSNHWISINQARENAILIYKDLATLLNKDITLKDFILDESILNKYVGTYVNEKDPNAHIEINLSNGWLVMQESDTNRKITFLYYRYEKEFALHQRNGITRFNRSDSNKIEMTIYVGHEATTYIKVSETNN